MSKPVDATVPDTQHDAGMNGRARRSSRSRLLATRFLRNRTGVAGLLIVVMLIILALVGPWLSPWGYDEVDRQAYLQPPSLEHPMGTTQSGRDMWALTLHGLRKSLIIGFIVAILSTGIAAVVGSFAAFYGGWIERFSLWIIDLLLVIPAFLLIALVASNMSGGASSWLLLVLLLSIFGWMLSARVVRSLTLSVKQNDYVLAARYMGLSGPKIVIRHILPNIASLLIIDATLNVSGAILAETSLAYFGFGVQPPDTSLGSLLGDGARQLSSFPWLFAGPAFIIVLLILSVNAVGDGLRDAFDPASQSAKRS
ncbi:MAG: ABC transporter permease [Granulosicoccus sp.]